MQVTIRYVDKILFSGKVDEINLPGLQGKVGIKPHHAMMSVILCAGEISVVSANHNERFAIAEGIAHVNNNAVDVLLVG